MKLHRNCNMLVFAKMYRDSCGWTIIVLLVVEGKVLQLYHTFVWIKMNLIVRVLQQHNSIRVIFQCWLYTFFSNRIVHILLCVFKLLCVSNIKTKVLCKYSITGKSKNVCDVSMWITCVIQNLYVTFVFWFVCPINNLYYFPPLEANIGHYSY